MYFHDAVIVQYVEKCIYSSCINVTGLRTKLYLQSNWREKTDSLIQFNIVLLQSDTVSLFDFHTAALFLQSTLFLLSIIPSFLSHFCSAE